MKLLNHPSGVKRNTKKSHPGFIAILVILVCTLGFAVHGSSQEVMEPVLASGASADIHEIVAKTKGAFSGNEEPAGRITAVAGMSTTHRIQRQITSIQNSFEKLEAGLDRLVEGFFRLPGDVALAMNNLSEGKGFLFVLFTLLKVLLIYGVSLGLERYVRRLTSPVRHYFEQAPVEYFFNKVLRNGLLLLLNGLYFAVFFYAAMVLIALTLVEGSNTRMIAGGYLAPIFSARVLVVIFAFVFCPNSKTARITPITDYAAQVLFFYFSAVVIVTPLIGRTLFTLSILGISDETFLFLQFFGVWVGFFIMLHMIFKNRHTLTDFMAEHSVSAKESKATAWIYERWYLLISVYLIGMVAIRDVSLLMGNDNFRAFALSIASVPGAILLEMLIWSLLSSAFPLDPANPEDIVVSNQIDPAQVKDDRDGVELSKPRQASKMVIQMHNTARVFILIGLVIFLLEIWGVEFAFSKGVVGAIFSASAAVTIAYFVWEYLNQLIDKNMDNGDQAEEEMDEGGAGGSRKSTLLLLLKKIIIICITIITLFVVLSGIGIEIGPLLAGAGIFGIAIGFGAQTLVRDIFSGVFFLIDDAFRIGDFVESGAHKGTVEHISIRTLRLRHTTGSVHTIPYGELGSITNYSRDYVLMKLDFRVPADTDIEKVRKIIKKIGLRFLEHPEHGPKFLQPLKSQGVKMIDDDSALVVRMKFKTTPGEQFVLRREVFRAVQEDFAKNDIQFAPRKVTVHIPEHMSGERGESATKEEMKTAIAGAVIADTGKENRVA
ncbi:mechanosensitive ion channel family protein [Desulfosediminicola flagellatus]|uniref:mechanosensitive ion channel family protein n=1 Tax=Desulfosediminicola flagellatus TaxID=2569541 RepID=UPI0010ABD31C|nr:mechanosensitive ion channel family protein [Desulfosediminicola flagellatus]